jgi:hypothetical protein
MIRRQRTKPPPRMRQPDRPCTPGSCRGTPLLQETPMTTPPRTGSGTPGQQPTARQMPAGVYLSAAGCARHDAFLMRALRDLQLRDGSLPRDLAEIVAPIHAAAVEFRASVLVEAGSGTADDGSGSLTRVSVGKGRLTVQQAARLTGTSESYLRRLARRGVCVGGGRVGVLPAQARFRRPARCVPPRRPLCRACSCSAASSRASMTSLPTSIPAGSW